MGSEPNVPMEDPNTYGMAVDAASSLSDSVAPNDPVAQIEPQSTLTQRELMEMMKQFVDTATVTVSQPRLSLNPSLQDFQHIPLQFCDPSEDDLDDWLAQAELIKDRFEWNDWDAVVRLSHFLTGPGLKFYKTWKPNEGKRTWENFKFSLKELFPHKRNNGELLKLAVLYNSDQASSYVEYAREKAYKLRKVRISWPEDILVEVIVEGISDPQIRSFAHNHKCSDLTNLIEILENYSKHKTSKYFNNNPEYSRQQSMSRDFSSRDNLKRTRDDCDDRSNNTRCFECGKYGHVRRFCPNPANIRVKSENTTERPSETNSHAIPQCSFCNKKGHIDDNCWTKERIGGGSNFKKAKTVNFCSAEPMS